MTTIPQFDEVDQALIAAALKLHPSEVHGLMCGILSGKLPNTQSWEQLITGDDIKAPILLKKLYNASANQLADFLFEFELVLPNDEATLCIRAEALTLWCQGFLTGLKLAGVVTDAAEATETSEAIADLIEIAKMNYDRVVESEEDENAYIELVEYVRMAIILIYQEAHGQVKNSRLDEKALNHLH